MAIRSINLAIHVAILSLVVAGICTGAERAASVEYEFIQRPAGLQVDFGVPPNGDLRFLAIRAIDGFRVEAALSQPNSQTPETSTLVVSVHGSGGRYDLPPNGFLVRLLTAKGIAVLAINTRQSGRARVNTDNFLEVRRDIEAAVYTARAMGYRAIVLFGHSLGNIQVQYYAANNWDPDIKGVVLAGMFGNLPWKSRHMLLQNEEKYAQLQDASLRALREGKERDLLPMQMAWLSGDVPVTAQHFLTYRADESSAADGTYWIQRIPRPILLVRDEGDTTIASFEPSMLLSAARARGSLVPSIKFVSLANPKGPNPGGHVFVDNQQQLADTVGTWLREQRL
jgi:pimeloyl-ACP methyl ester carboxylesterase